MCNALFDEKGIWQGLWHHFGGGGGGGGSCLLFTVIGGI